MMKQTRMIRISFFIVTALIIGAFWGGFYFGGSLSGNADSGIQIASVEDQAQEAADGKKENTVAKQETVESMKALSEEKYYLKASGEYLSVYFSDTDRLYFETSLKVSDLPEKLRKNAINGIKFTSLENLYSFLENYSS